MNNKDQARVILGSVIVYGTSGLLYMYGIVEIWMWFNMALDNSPMRGFQDVIAGFVAYVVVIGVWSSAIYSMIKFLKWLFVIRN